MGDVVKYQHRSWLRRQLDRAAAWLGYEAALPGRSRNQTPIGVGIAPDELIAPSIATLRAKSHHVVRNHWGGSRAVDVLVARVVGNGLHPSCSGSPDLHELCTSWARPQQQVGSAKGQSLASVQRLAIRTVIESGAALVVWRPMSRAEMVRRGLVVPFVVEVFEPDWLDDERDDHGIEKDATGWPVAYYLRDPSSITRQASTRIDASRVSYLLRVERPGQQIGVPWLTPALVKIRDFDEFEDAELMRAKIASMFAAFVRSPATMGHAGGDEVLSLEPGRIQELAPGEDITIATPPTSGGYEGFARSQVRSIAGAVGLSYEDLSNDYSQVNFSSARMGALVTNALVDIWRDDLLFGILCSDLERWLLDAAELMGYARHDIEWTAPAHALIDPARELNATGVALKLGLTSRQAEIRKRGRDPEVVRRERLADAEADAEDTPETTSEDEPQLARIGRTA